MSNILLVGLPYDTNVGDQAIFDCTKQLVLNNDKNSTIFSIDLLGKNYYGDDLNSNKVNISYIVRRFIYPLKYKGEADCKLRNYLVEKSLIRSLDNIEFNTIDAIIFVGGGIIKYKYQEFYLGIDLITKIAEKYQIPVMFSGVGIEDYDDKSSKCLILKESLNRACVKSITTRDDIRILKDKYLTNPEIHTRKVSDPACSISKFFDGVESTIDNKAVGLGVVRPNLFIDNGINISKKDYILICQKIYTALSNQGYEIYLFDNGHIKDHEFACELLDILKLDKSHLISRPTNTQELVNIITGFCMTVVCRLHASIISYSFDIPTMGIIWNEKQSMFGNAIKEEYRFVQPEDAVSVVNEKLFLLLKQYKDDESRRNYISSCGDEISLFLKKYLK